MLENPGQEFPVNKILIVDCCNEMLKYSHIFRYSDDNNRRINPALQGGTKRQPGVQGPGPRGPPLGPLLGARPQGGHGQTQARQRPRDGEVVRGLQGQPLHQQCGTY